MRKVGKKYLIIYIFIYISIITKKLKQKIYVIT